jgi:hypothetical protein
VAGTSRDVQMLIDTLGFGINGFYRCDNCSSLQFGTATFAGGDTLRYAANPGVEAGRDTVRVRYCHPAGDTCSAASIYPFVAQRAGQNTFPSAITVSPEERVTLTAENNLPGALRCATFADCPDDYDGTEQLAFLTDYSTPVNSFVYEASRWAGVDSLCLVLCDVNGICDTSHYAFRINVPSFPLSVENIFMDDFSTGAPQPQADLWLDRAVYVNNELGYEPPSVGVATFDGLDYRGRPHPVQEDGTSDILTSTYIDVDANGNAPQFTFWVQRGGLSDRPETSDSLLLQFRTLDGSWETVWNLDGIRTSQPLSTIDPFQFILVPVATRYQHSRFQFRFINKGSNGAIRDTWHLDYVRLSYSTQAESFNDLAFTQVPDFLLGRYTSMPWSHFRVDPDAALSTGLPVEVYNHDRTAPGRIADTDASAGYGLRARETISSLEPFAAVDLLNGDDQNLSQGRNNYGFDFVNEEPYRNARTALLQTINAGTYDNQDEVHLETTYALSPIGQASTTAARANDVVQRTTVFSNYFAYDDGTAESAIEAGPGRQLAVAYETGIADTLRGVSIHFPHTGAAIEEQRFRLKVWIGSLDSDPVYEGDYQPFFTTSFYDTLQGFTSYPLIDFRGNEVAIPLPAGDFFVGWEQLTNCKFAECIGIGYDRNRPDARDYIFREGNTGWEPIVGITRGALMIRPIVGSEMVLPTTVDDLHSNDRPLRVYPNPAQRLIHFAGWQNLSVRTRVSLYNSAGQQVLESALRSELQLPSLPTGLYFLRFQDPEQDQQWVEPLLIQ